MITNNGGKEERREGTSYILRICQASSLQHCNYNSLGASKKKVITFQNLHILSFCHVFLGS